jgi:molybdate transport system permease protein
VFGFHDFLLQVLYITYAKGEEKFQRNFLFMGSLCYIVDRMATIAEEKEGRGDTRQRRESVTLQRSLGEQLWKLSLLPYLLLILLPLLAIFSRVAPAQILENLRQVEVLQAIRLSMLTSTLTTLLALLLGTPVAYYLSHRSYRFFRLVDSLVDLPTILPPAVAGLALLMAFGRRGLLGAELSALGISIPFTTAAVVIAQLFVAAPLYIKAAAVGFSAVDCELKKAAALDGANRWQVFRHIMAPIAWTAILSGGVMTWARSLGEFGATIIFAGNFPGRTQTMPLAIYIGFELSLGTALTISVILIGISFLTLILVKGFLHQRFDGITASERD